MMPPKDLKKLDELYYKYDYKPFFDAGVLRNSLANEVYEGLL